MSSTHNLLTPFFLLWLMLSAVLLTGCQTRMTQPADTTGSLINPAYAKSALYKQFDILLAVNGEDSYGG